MLWRPSCPPFCKHVTGMSEINFNMLNRFLDFKNLCVATKSMRLAHILKKILRILSFGGHLGPNLNISISPMMPRWHHSVSMYGHIGEHIYAKTFCADYFFGLHPKSSFGNLTIFCTWTGLDNTQIGSKILTCCFRLYIYLYIYSDLKVICMLELWVEEN